MSVREHSLEEMLDSLRGRLAALLRAVVEALEPPPRRVDPYADRPWDDEPLSEEELAAIAEAEADIAAGRTVTLEDFERELESERERA